MRAHWKRSARALVIGLISTLALSGSAFADDKMPGDGGKQAEEYGAHSRAELEKAINEAFEKKVNDGKQSDKDADRKQSVELYMSITVKIEVEVKAETKAEELAGKKADNEKIKKALEDEKKEKDEAAADASKDPEKAEKVTDDTDVEQLKKDMYGLICDAHDLFHANIELADALWSLNDPDCDAAAHELWDANEDLADSMVSLCEDYVVLVCVTHPEEVPADSWDKWLTDWEKYVDYYVIYAGDDSD